MVSLVRSSQRNTLVPITHRKTPVALMQFELVLNDARLKSQSAAGRRAVVQYSATIWVRAARQSG